MAGAAARGDDAVIEPLLHGIRVPTRRRVAVVERGARRG